MSASSFRLPALIYRYLAINQGRSVPFEELCIFVTISGCSAETAAEILSVERASQTRIMNTLIFLSDINLIKLDPDTDHSCVNEACRN